MLAYIHFACLLLGSAAASSATNPGRRQPMSGRRAATIQGQNVPDDCTLFDSITSSGQDCEYLASFWGISTEDFISWNPVVGADCGNIVVGEEYCVERNWGIPVPSTSTSRDVPGPTSTVPSPTQTGIIQGCTEYYKAVDGDDCSNIVAAHGTFSLTDFLNWNPAVGSGCGGLWLGYWYCVAIEGTPTQPPTPPSSTTSAGNGIKTPTPIQPGMVNNCNKFALVKDTTTCQGIADYNKVTFAEVLEWNTALNKDCTNLWLGYYVCAGVAGSASPPPTTTSAGNGITTPTPTQSGMVSNCNKFHLIKDTTTCQGIADYNKVSFADVLKWNTGLNKDCTNLWLGTYACAGVIGGGSSPPPSTTRPPGNGIATPTPTQPGMVSNCNKFARVQSTTTCESISNYYKISMGDILKWNTGFNKACTNLWLDTYYCVGVISGSNPPPSTTTSAGNGIATPTPTQPGMVSNCNTFHLIKDTTTCQGIADYNKVSLSDILKWNTGINQQCTNLWLGAYACAGVIGGGNSPPPTTTTSRPGNGVATPTPTQPGMVSNCNRFARIQRTTTCQSISDYYKITIANIRRWNTGVNSACTNLWLDTYVCIGVIGQSRIMAVGGDVVDEKAYSSSSDLTSSPIPTATSTSAESSSASLFAPSADSSTLSSPSMVQVPIGTPGPLR